MTVAASRMITTPIRSVELEATTDVAPPCSVWLCAWCGPLQSSLKQHSSFTAAPFDMWALSQKDLYAQDFITESVVAHKDTKRGQNGRHRDAPKKTHQ